MPEESEWKARGRTQFLNRLRVPDGLANMYPTRDTHSAEDEQQFIEGFEEERRKYQLQQGNEDDLWDGEPWLEDY